MARLIASHLRTPTEVVMAPTSFAAAALLPLFPLALVIDYGVIIKGTPAAGKTHRLRIVITVASGKGVDSDLESGRLADPERLHWQLATTLMFDKKWSFSQHGLRLVILGFDGSPVTKVEITGNGPKPKWRWIPRPK
jgi:hypothetical protein